MLNQRMPSFVIAAALLLLLDQSETALSANYAIDLTFDQRLAAGGQKEYSVRAGFTFDDPNNRLIAPDGRVFDYQHLLAERLTYQQFATMAFGEWNAETTTSEIVFQVPALGQENAAFLSPVITSPAPGSEVPQVFTVNWQGESRGFAEALKRTNIASLSSFHPDECCSTTFTARLLGEGKGSLELDVYTRTILPSPQIVGQFPLGGDTYTFDARFRSHAPLALYTVVPESSTLFLVALVVICGAMVRRR